MSTIFYCHYNVISGEISKISPQSEKDNPEDLSICVFEIPEETAISMLSGETSPHDWVAIRDSRGFVGFLKAVAVGKETPEMNAKRLAALEAVMSSSSK